MNDVDRKKIRQLTLEEDRIFEGNHKKSKEFFERSKKHLLAGVPMNWMVRWAGSFPIFVKEAVGCKITDVDGNRYLDLCLGDTGSMFGHSPEPVVKAIGEQIGRGITMMLPTEDSIWIGEELERRFGLPYWQISMTATDANRFSIRLARRITGRKKILVVNECYHGSVDEALITFNNGVPGPSEGNIGPAIDPSITTELVEFNDIDAVEKALSSKEVACVLMEPAMTNIGIILPDEDYHERLRELATRYGSLLILDETHTICCGPGGYTGEYGLKPDIITIGKPIAGGVPAAAYGINEGVAELVRSSTDNDTSDESGVGGTLSGNALAIAAMRATLEHVITKEAFDHMLPVADRFTRGIDNVIRSKELPWHVIQLGTRLEYRFRRNPPRNGGEAAAAVDYELDRLMHLMALNRGILLTPFHNMALMSPFTTNEDADFHTEVFRESVEKLIG